MVYIFMTTQILIVNDRNNNIGIQFIMSSKLESKNQSPSWRWRPWSARSEPDALLGCLHCVGPRAMSTFAHPPLSSLLIAPFSTSQHIGIFIQCRRLDVFKELSKSATNCSISLLQSINEPTLYDQAYGGDNIQSICLSVSAK